MRVSNEMLVSLRPGGGTILLPVPVRLSSDIAAFHERLGLPANNPIVIVNGPDPNASVTFVV